MSYTNEEKVRNRSKYCTDPNIKCYGICIGVDLQKTRMTKCVNYVGATYTFFMMEVPTTAIKNTHQPLPNTSTAPNTNKEPSIGDVVYVPSEGFLSHGVDDFIGGKAHVSRINDGMSGGERTRYIEVKERPGTSYNWKILGKDQDWLRDMFGDQMAHKDPDLRSEFNEA